MYDMFRTFEIHNYGSSTDMNQSVVLPRQRKWIRPRSTAGRKMDPVRTTLWRGKGVP